MNETERSGNARVEAAERAGMEPEAWGYMGLVFLTFLLAVYLRLGGIPHIEPILFHPDETEFVVRALRVLKTGNMNPGWFAHPGTLTIYNLSLVYAIEALLRGAPFEGLIAEYRRDPTPFHVLGKYVAVSWSMVEHFALWILARQFVARWPALLAVFFLATARLDVTVATLIRTDTQQSALLLLLCLFAVRAVETARLRWFALAGVALGLASAVKWPSVVACFAIALSALLTVGPQGPWRVSPRKLLAVSVAAVVSVGALFLATPYAFFDFDTVLANVAHEARSRDLGPSHSGIFAALAFYFRIFLSSTSIPGLVLAVLGLVASLRSITWRKYAVVLCLFVVYLLFICTQSVHWPRWAVPLVPYLCLFSAVGVVRVLDVLRPRLGRAALSAATATALVAIVTVPASANVVRLLEQRARGEPAVQATQWIAQHVPPGSRVLTERAAPYLPGGMFDVYIVGRGRGRLERVTQQSRYYVPAGQVGYLKDAERALRSVDYVMLGNYHARVRKQPAGHRGELRAYEEILRGSTSVLKLGPYRIRKVKKDGP